MFYTIYQPSSPIKELQVSNDHCELSAVTLDAGIKSGLIFHLLAQIVPHSF